MSIFDHPISWLREKILYADPIKSLARLNAAAIDTASYKAGEGGIAWIFNNLFEYGSLEIARVL